MFYKNILTHKKTYLHKFEHKLSFNKLIKLGRRMARNKMARNKEEIKAFTVNFPKSIVEDIDLICSSEYITRTSWLLRAARELLNKERLKRTEDLIAKISEEK